MKIDLHISAEGDVEVSNLFAALSTMWTKRSTVLEELAAYTAGPAPLPAEAAAFLDGKVVPYNTDMATEAAPVVEPVVAAEPVKRTRKPRQPVVQESAPEGSPSRENPGVSVDLMEALDAAGAVSLGDEETEEAETEVEAKVEDSDDMMADMLAASPAKAPEPKPEAAQVAQEPAVDADDPRTAEQLHTAIRDQVILNGGDWLREVLAQQKVNRISDLTKAKALKALAIPGKAKVG